MTANKPDSPKAGTPGKTSKTTNPIPEGFRTLTPHLVVNGAAAAIEFYKQAFQAEEVARMDSPGGMVMHAELRIGDSMFMLGDEDPKWNKGPKTLGGTAVTVCIYTPDCDKVFARAVAAGATPIMPPADMFWGDRFAKLRDPFGHEWSIATHQEDVTPQECARRGAEFMKQMGK